VKAGVEDILSKAPNPDTCTSADQKIRAHLLRARAKLLMPVFSKEAELEINKALKLNQKAPDTWVTLSEAYWRRNALREARDALDSALRIEPKHQGALVQYSRILRSMCSQPETPNEQKIALLKESEGKAKEAVAVNPNDGDSWSALAVALLQQAVGNGMELPLMKKALSALNQACGKVPTNPDVYFNRAVVHAVLGHFGAAVADYLKAYELDPKGLKGAKLAAEQHASLLLKAHSKFATGYGGLTERDFKKNIAPKLPTSGKDGAQVFISLMDVLDKQFTTPQGKEPEVKWVAVKVMDLMSNQNEQPLTYLVIDKEGTSCLLLAYRVTSAAMKIGDTVMVPFPPSSAANLGHQLPDIPMLDIKSTNICAPTMIAEPSTLIVNGSPIPAKCFKMPQLGTRQFQ
jgi:tetratricopeptide (TPR) repeat protein